MLIDSHVHIFPETVKNFRKNYFNDGNFRLLYENPASKIIFHNDAILYMREKNIDKIFSLGFSWQSAEMCIMHNNMIAAETGGSSVLISFASLPSRPFNDVAGYIKELSSMGFSGIGELSFYTAGFDDELWTYLESIFAACSSNSMILVLHVNEPVGHRYAGKYITDFSRLSQLIENYPDLRLVLSHWGGGIFIYELMPEIRKTFRNVFYDTAASPFLYDNRIYRHAADIIGSDRILFGTDFPLLGPEKYLTAFNSSDLYPDEIQKICCENAERLIGFK